MDLDLSTTRLDLGLSTTLVDLDLSTTLLDLGLSNTVREGAGRGHAAAALLHCSHAAVSVPKRTHESRSPEHNDHCQRGPKAC